MFSPPINWEKLPWFNWEEFDEASIRIDRTLHAQFWLLIAENFKASQRSVLRNKAHIGMDVHLPGYLED
jgi:hypothetical protein